MKDKSKRAEESPTQAKSLKFQLVLHTGSLTEEEKLTTPLEEVPTTIRMPNARSALAMVRGMHFAKLDEAIRDSVRIHVAAIVGDFQGRIDDAIERIEEANQRRDVAPERRPLREAFASELLLGIAGLAADSPDVLAPLSRLIPQPAESNGPLFLKKVDYAERIAVGVRTLDKLIARGLPTVGAGKLRRIPVAEADAVVGKLLSEIGGGDDDSDPIEQLARERVRTAAGA